MGLFFKPNIKKLKAKRNIAGLIMALKDHDEDVRKEAAKALGDLNDKRAVEPLIAALNDKDLDVRKEAEKVLANIGESAVESLINALHNKDKDVRKKAAVALGKIKDKRAVKPLISLLKDNNRIVRKAAADSLGKIKDKGSTKLLIALLSDEDDNIRKRVAVALGKLEDTKAVGALISALNDENYDVRDEAAKALKKIGTPEAIKALKGIAKLKKKKARYCYFCNNTIKPGTGCLSQGRVKKWYKDLVAQQALGVIGTSSKFSISCEPAADGNPSVIWNWFCAKCAFTKLPHAVAWKSFNDAKVFWNTGKPPIVEPLYE